MNAHPLIHRELLVASRQSSTWWVRVGTGLLTALLFLLLVSSLPGGNLRATAFGTGLFSSLTFVAFLLAGLSGVRSAALPLAGENRENTLGLLLLTTLRRHEVVLGKLAAASLLGLASLLAFVPVLALALVAGGVTLSQVGMAAATVGLTLLLSNAAGLYVAAIRSNDLQVVLCTLGMMLVACLPLGWLLLGVAFTTELDAAETRRQRIGDTSRLPGWWPYAAYALLWLPLLALLFLCLQWDVMSNLLLFASPAYLLFLTFSAGSTTLFCAHAAGLSWFLVCLVWLTATRLSADGGEQGEPETSMVNRPPPVQAPIPRLPATAAPGSTPPVLSPLRTTERPRELLENGPFLWWLHPPEARRHLVWGAAVAVGLAGLLPFSIGRLTDAVIPLLVLLNVFGTIFAPVLDYLIAWQAARLLAEARQSGSLELLLVTPGFREQALRDIWRSLRVVFLQPVIVMLSLRLLGAILHGLIAGEPWPFFAPGLPVFVARTLAEVASFAALAWVGIWQSWQSPRPAFAAIKAFLIASLLPLLFSLPFRGLGLMWNWGTVVWQLALAGFFLALAVHARRQVRRTFLAGTEPVAVRRR